MGPTSSQKKPKGDQAPGPPLTPTEYNSKKEEYGRKMKELRSELYQKLCKQRANDRVAEKGAARAVELGREAKKDLIREKRKQGMEEREQSAANLKLATVGAKIVLQDLT